MGGVYELDASTVDSRLVRWGRWKMDCGRKNGFPKQSAFMKLTPSSGHSDYYDNLEHECIETDSIVQIMPPYLQLVIVAQYVFPYRSVAVKAYNCRLQKRTFYNRLNEAKEIFAKKINERLRMVHNFDINMVSRSVLREAIS